METTWDVYSGHLKPQVVVYTRPKGCETLGEDLPIYTHRALDSEKLGQTIKQL